MKTSCRALHGKFVPKSHLLQFLTVPCPITDLCAPSVLGKAGKNLRWLPTQARQRLRLFHVTAHRRHAPSLSVEPQQCHHRPVRPEARVRAASSTSLLTFSSHISSVHLSCLTAHLFTHISSVHLIAQLLFFLHTALSQQSFGNLGCTGASTARGRIQVDPSAFTWRN